MKLHLSHLGVGALLLAAPFSSLARPLALGPEKQEERNRNLDASLLGLRGSGLASEVLVKRVLPPAGLDFNVSPQLETKTPSARDQDQPSHPTGPSQPGPITRRSPQTGRSRSQKAPAPPKSQGTRGAFSPSRTSAQRGPSTKSGAPGPSGSGSGSGGGSYPPGIVTAGAKEFWDTMTRLIREEKYRLLEPEDQVVLYTGTADNQRRDFVRKLSTRRKEANSQINIRYLANVMGHPEMTDAKTRYRQSPGYKESIEDAVLSAKFAEIVKAHNREVHTFFPSSEDAQRAAATGELPNGIMKFFELPIITSPGSRVPLISIWDANTYQEKMKKETGPGKDQPQYHLGPSRLWKAGDPQLGLVGSYDY
ncbi:hypothetical protein MAPG_00943 [Magnaporthiopsis poae ATCC 64411]|uniref:Uncharacterized protein n=1 Tax=Magnaporthiopsis poae (strain ATCC 64411 / 73-15) TaxID=644358 RepID=A0A0C4DMD7_MAGP6|nr:hypothetical protein MAPG_00943 [Magnaporthiopsis poae ATCC 64411]